MTAGELGFVHRFVEGSSDDTLLLLHGTGGDENDLLALGRELAPSANLLSPRGQVLEHGMPRFFKRLAMGVFDVDDLKGRATDLAAFVAGATDHYGLDGGRLTALGYSNGANIAAAVLLQHPGVLRRAALLHAMVPFEARPLPDLSGTSVLLTGGRRDAMVPVDQAEALGRMLSDAGADVALELQPGGHELTPAELDAVRAWLSKAIRS